jgi:hypothetical protein
MKAISPLITNSHLVILESFFRFSSERFLFPEFFSDKHQIKSIRLNHTIMISPPPVSSSGAGSRRSRYTRSPSGGAPSSKRSKASSSIDPYDRNHGSGSDQARLYTSICVKNINPKISDLGTSSD